MTMLNPTFDGLLNETQAVEALRDFEAALRAALTAMASSPIEIAVRKAHALITYALVFGASDLVRACRSLEATVAEGRDAAAAVVHLQREIKSVAADLPLGPDQAVGRQQGRRP